ncbi:MAG: peptidoglycan recognition protein family protein [Mycobacterium sp.]
MCGEQHPVDRDVTAISRRKLLAAAATVGLAATGCSNKAVSVLTQPTLAFTADPPPGSVHSLDAPVSTAVPAAMLCRESWGARPALPGGRPHTITRMTIHHSAVALPDNRGIVARLQQHQRYHQDDKGWVDIAYHAAVDRNGNIFALRDTAIAGDTATDYDTTGHFLVLCEGDFNTETVTEAQLDGAALICAWATQQFGIGVNTLASHTEVTPVTDCPGDNLEAHLTSGDLKQRITARIATGFDLGQVCGTAAGARVAAITAGR